MKDEFKSSKLSRFLTLGSSLTKASAQLALDSVKEKAQKVIDKNDDLKNLTGKIKATKEIVTTMGEMKGAMMKLGQMISISDDLLIPKEISDLFKDLQKQSPPMSDEEVLKMFHQNFGKTPNELFLKFEMKPVAAASIGQVHRATLNDGREVAVKIQYPKIVEAIKNDFSNLHKIDQLLKFIYPGKPNLDNIIKELKQSLITECDYLIEAEKLNFFRLQYRDKFPMIQIPEPILELTTKEILVMEWISGDSFEKTLSYSPDDRNFLGQTLYECFLYSLWDLGQMHTDPQNGNYLFTPNKIIMLDFGSTREFSKEFLSDYCALFLSLETNNSKLYEKITKKLDIFEESDAFELIEKHFKLIQDLYLPYNAPGVRPITETNPVVVIREFLKDIELAGRKSPRQEFLLLDRSTFGLYTKLKAWKSQINWLEGRNKFRISLENEVKIKELLS
jgi:predicted unusual protein kinase regulating ubiquinone biosynthesis (AarF/ABC1/UbiB family)